MTPWTHLEATATFAVGVAEMELTPRPVNVSDARVVMSATYERALAQWSDGEYSSLPNKTQAGVPVAYELRRTPTAMTMRLWPVPATETTISYTYARVIEDVAAGDVLDVPQMWGEAIRKMLKARLTAFRPEGMPQYVLAEAEIAKRQLLDFDRPESYRLGAAI